jgi:hypothetical protein
MSLTWSFEALTRLARGAVPVVLAPPVTWPSPGAVTKAWSLRVASLGGVECRLGSALAASDLAFCISAASGVRATLSRDAQMFAGGDQATVGSSVATFLARWCEPRSPLHAGVAAVWLEFDHEPRETARASPFVVYKIAEDTQSRESMAMLLREGAGALAEGSDGAAVEAAVRCLSELPRGVRLLHVGVAALCGGAAVRLIVALTRSDVAGALRRLEWPGDAIAAGATLEALWPGDDTVAVHLDFSVSLGPRVGVEFYRPSSPLDDPLWMPLLDGLVERGWCTPEKRAAAVAWPNREANVITGRETLLRQLMVKIVFAPNDVTEAKAYLAFMPRPTLFGNPAHRYRPSVPAH